MPGPTGTGTADQGPTPRGPVDRSPGDLRAVLASKPLPRLGQASDVPAFVEAAGAAPVSRREEVRALIQAARDDTAIANRLIAEFEIAAKTDHSRALVILSLLGEQRNPAGTAFLIAYAWRPLPRGGRVVEESGMSAAAEAMVRLQVKAANAIPYARTKEALQAALDLAGKHPSKAVRAEAASSYLWNQGNSEEARRALSAVLRRDELMLLDRPVRGVGMSAEQFNRQLALYLERHPALRPPDPVRRRGWQAAATSAAAQDAQVSPPADEGSVP